ncbi:aminotransferase class V-fold PLP-dependent enzyme, partial [Candidatus Sumerlaeota bacterium]|nr:aminotransferase class V-fold PLP-dependent enzyme [Candidatus Sumerlaeota bacterium]
PHRVICSTVEHDAVRRCLLALEHEGIAEIAWVPAHESGVVDLDAATEAMRRPAAAAALMHVNNETGVIQPLAAWAERARSISPEILLLCDAVQAVARLPLELDSADLLVISAHKFHGPPGIGALIRRRPVALEPLTHGGGQEGGLRAGTESTALIVGLGAALRRALAEWEGVARILTSLTETFLNELRRLGITHQVIGESAPRAPGILGLTFPQIEAADLVVAADLEGLSLSAGSACHSGTPEPSHVLQAMGLSSEAVRHTIRVAFHRGQSPDEAIEAARRLADILRRGC